MDLGNPLWVLSIIVRGQKADLMPLSRNIIVIIGSVLGDGATRTEVG